METDTNEINALTDSEALRLVRKLFALVGDEVGSHTDTAIATRLNTNPMMIYRLRTGKLARALQITLPLAVRYAEQLGPEQ